MSREWEWRSLKVGAISESACAHVASHADRAARPSDPAIASRQRSWSLPKELWGGRKARCSARDLNALVLTGEQNDFERIQHRHGIYHPAPHRSSDACRQQTPEVHEK
eukprot:753656-Hanusia_phi.AAC.16